MFTFCYATFCCSTSSANKGEVNKSAKIPSMVPPPSKPTKNHTAEADAIPSSTYKTILDAKLNKHT
jgi:hypothetical protein